ncbi:Zinc finger BED domain-containing protein RICESLEEPER 2 [Mycena venus]|uniref:Zinc finger BED domain-containing protein RICESLEEPER 2 n=1 Tax=Mycena venus TaxID=2733690 RepID=A0A8H6ZA74_9AGAR|nr:Zinc finger BED domain-containing protein RICESLEEPER 2 [Mycena venus]
MILMTTILLPPVKTSSTKATNITEFFQRRSSSRISHPSARVSDPNNAESALKRKAPWDLDQPRSFARARTSHAARSSSPSELDNDGDEIPSLRDASDSEDDGDEEDMEEEDEDEVEAAYEATKALGDANREVMGHRNKAEATLDIKPMYTMGEMLDADTGEMVKGMRESIPKSASFSGMSRHGGCTLKVYKRLCEKNQVAIHPRVTPDDILKGIKGDAMEQTTLNGFAMKIPPFKTDGMLDHLVKLVVSEDNAFRLVDKGPFRRLMHYMRPSLQKKDLLHRTKMMSEVLERTKKVEARLREKIKNIPGQVSFTFDTWTSDTGDPYLSVTGHYIDSPADKPSEWSLKCDQLSFTPIEGNHSGQNLFKILVRIVDWYDLREKIGWCTADNATNNDSALKAFGTRLVPSSCVGMQMNVVCMENAVHLGAGHFISDELKKANPEMNDEKFEALLNGDGDGEGGDSDDEVDDVAPADAVRKALALVKQIRMSPQAQAFFKRMCVDTGVPTLQLLGWVRTRWASIFTFFERLLKLRPAVNRFVLLTDGSPEVPKLAKKFYSDFRFSRTDWEKIEKMHEVLQEPANIQQSFSNVGSPTVWRTLPLLEALQKTWENMAATKKFAEMRGSIEAALDPNFKTAYVASAWDSDAYKNGLILLEAKFDAYYVAPDPVAQPEVVVTPAVTVPVQYGHSWMKAKILARKQQDASVNDPRQELKAYLNTPLEEVDDVVAWWGRHYPTLARMARDYLAIQGSATASERAFSSGSLTATKRRNRLAPATFEALQSLKSAYRNDHIGAAEEATERMISHFDALESDDDGDVRIWGPNKWGGEQESIIYSCSLEPLYTLEDNVPK